MLMGPLFLDSNSSADKHSQEKKKEPNTSINEETESQNSSNQTNEEENELDTMKDKLNDLQVPSMNSFRMLLSLDFYLVFLIIFIIVGSGITIINNLGSVVLAYGGHNGQQNLMVIIFSICNCAGRLLFGLLSDKFLNPQRNITRITFLAICIVLMSITQFLFAVMPLEGFYPLIILLGVSTI